MTDPDSEAIGRLLLRIEADAHRYGWDEPADLYVLYDARDIESDREYRHVLGVRRGPAVRCWPYAAQSAVPRHALDGNPAHAVFRFSLTARTDHPAAEYVFGTLRQPGFVGMAMLHEGWQLTVANEGEREALGDVRFADTPGAVEARYVLATDSAGVDYMVQRVRGMKPRLERSGVGDFVSARGAIIESLRTITARVLGNPLPEIDNVPSRWDWDAERANAGSE